MPPTANCERVSDEIALDVVMGSRAHHRREAGAVELVRLRGPQRVAGADPEHLTEPRALTPLAGGQSDAAQASLCELDGRTISTFRIEGGKHVGAIGPPEGQVLERAVRVAIELGIPIVGTIASSGADVIEGVSSLHAWGHVARSLADASGVVPTILVVVGPCVSGPALLLGIADLVVMTSDAFAYVSGPDTVRAFTGIELDNIALGGATMHGSRSGVASFVVADEDAARELVAVLLEYLPSNHLSDPPSFESDDPVDRDCTRAQRRCRLGPTPPTTFVSCSTTCSTRRRSSRCARSTRRTS